jgi:phosphoglycerate kinase
MTFQTLDDLSNIAGMRVLCRVDLNVPLQDGRVSDTTRMEAIKATVLELSNKGAKVILIAHLGRPKGAFKPELSLGQIVKPLSEVLGRDVVFLKDDASEQIAALPSGGIALLENIRMDKEEEENNPLFVQALARLGDLFVNDGFSVSHRAHASTVGLAHVLPAYAGRAMEKELNALQQALGKPEKPLVAVVGGAKVSTKIDVLKHLVKQVDTLIVGGGMANTFLAAQGVNVQASLCEHDLKDTALSILNKAEQHNCQLILPVDVVCAESFQANSPHQVCDIHHVPEGSMILDFGPQSIEAISAVFEQSRTLVWNGPLGAFELEPFDKATVTAARHAANLVKMGDLLAVAGGGDTVAALHHAGVAGDFSYVSTAGGAFLEWMEGKPLPGVEALKRSAQAA